MTRVVGGIVTAAMVIGAGALWLFGGGVESRSQEPAAPPVEGEGLVEFVFTDGTVVGFEISEELWGSPNVVVGISDRVAGRLAVDPDDPSTLQLGQVLVDARAFDTGSGLRDRAIRSLILETGTYEFITFTFTRVEDLAQSGGEVVATVVGELTVRDVIRPVSFVVRVEMDGDRLVGVAEGAVLRSEFGLEIPSVRGVANVADRVELFVEFVADRP